MSEANTAWEQRMIELWTTIDACAPDLFLARMDALAAERPAGDGAALFERGAARDSTGHPVAAIGFYRRALAAGLTELRRRRVNIQLASSLRSLGHPEEAYALLHAELGAASKRAGRRLLGFPSPHPGRSGAGAGGRFDEPRGAGASPPPLQPLACYAYQLVAD